MFELWFYGNDGEFEYCVGVYHFPEFAFRHAQTRARIEGWTFDGDGWSSLNDCVFDSGHEGKYFIIRQS